MDQDTTGGTDKRNWRERLGIGNKEPMTKDMPRVASEFTPASPAGRPAAAATVKPAPMAPRAMAPRPAVKPAAAPAARPATAGAPAAQPIMRPAPIAPDALANKLKSQRDAAEKLAEQRVMAARQRAEAAMSPAATPASAARPKFTFADDEAKPAKGALPPRSALPPQRPNSVLPPQAAQPAASAYVPQIAPPRQPLGGAAPLPPQRPLPPQQAYPQGQPYGQQQPYVPSYVQPPAYRPIDPETGYAPPPAYNPPARPAYGAAPNQQPPRLQVPQRTEGYGAQPGRLNAPAPSRGPALPRYGDAEDDIFEQPAPQRSGRRATANDYQQAYREVEQGYDDEPSRSNVPWILAGLLFLVLAGFGSIWAYTNYLKPQMATPSGQSVPVVQAPAAATKVTPDATNNATAAAPGEVAQPTKKQIYDRIVGDSEVLGGQIVPTEQPPVQPSTNLAPVPEPAPQTAPATGTGNDGTPLPLPPPPGATGEGTQGALDPAGKIDQQVANITPAAGASPAANLPVSAAGVPAQPAAALNNSASPLNPPKSLISPLATPSGAAPEAAKEQGLAASETIQDSNAAEAAPLTLKKPKLDEAKKVTATATPEKSLGSKPIVLVPPAKKIVSSKQVAIVDPAPTTMSIYGNDTSSTDAPVIEPPQVIAPEPVRKRKTLLDLFKKDDAATVAPADAGAVVQGQPELLPAPEPAQRVAAITPPPVQQPVPASGAYVAQLASFKTKTEATQEYARMRDKHGAIIGRYAPLITQAQVAGTPRYRLSIGPMASADVASGLCKSLFAAGERDCLVRRQ